jgi:catechol 2,3-dioxygenase-like lactoylglutathione lyase family enzyme
MPQHIAHVPLLVRDYDEAISFFTRSPRFELIADTPSTDRPGPDKRWVLVAPPNSAGTSMLLAKASNEKEATRVAIRTEDVSSTSCKRTNFWRDYRTMTAKGVKFLREPKNQLHGTVTVFEDLCGNRWDLLPPVKLLDGRTLGRSRLRRSA